MSAPGQPPGTSAGLASPTIVAGADCRSSISTFSPESIGVALAALGATAAASKAVGTINDGFFIPFILEKLTPIRRLAVMSGATMAGNVDLGVYDALGNRIVSKGAVSYAGTTSSWFEVDIPDIFLPPGQYFLATSFSSATATFWGWDASSAFGTTGLKTILGAGVKFMASAHPLPAIATFSGYQNSMVPILSANTLPSVLTT